MIAGLAWYTGGIGTHAADNPEIRTIIDAALRGELTEALGGRVAARLSRHRGELFAFLGRPEGDWSNHFAEWQIRPR